MKQNKLSFDEVPEFEGVPIFGDLVNVSFAEKGSRDDATLKELLRLPFDFLVDVFDALRLRVPFCEKKQGFAEIIDTEKDEEVVKITTGSNGLGCPEVSIPIRKLYVMIDGRTTFIEVGRKIFKDCSTGDKVLVDYINGRRLHARLASKGI